MSKVLCLMSEVPCTMGEVPCLMFFLFFLFLQKFSLQVTRPFSDGDYSVYDQDSFLYKWTDGNFQNFQTLGGDFRSIYHKGVSATQVLPRQSAGGRSRETVLTFENHCLQRRLTFGDPFQDSDVVYHPGGNPWGTNLMSISHKGYLFEEVFVLELTKETI